MRIRLTTLAVALCLTGLVYGPVDALARVSDPVADPSMGFIATADDFTKVPGGVYTKGELKILGLEFQWARQQFNKEAKEFDEWMKHIHAVHDPDLRERLKEARLAQHTRVNNNCSEVRNKVQLSFIEEANARIAHKRGVSPSGNKNALMNDLRQTAGTKFGDKNFRGWAGDMDLGGGYTTADVFTDIMQMAIPGITVENNAGVVSFGDGFELTINKEGPRSTPGSAMYQAEVYVGARDPETYVSVSMKEGQPGYFEVQVNDHCKKAAKGLKVSPQTLAADPALMQTMVKGTMKTLNVRVMSDADIAAVLKRNGIAESPREFRAMLENIKGNRAFIRTEPEAKKMQEVCSDLLTEARIRARNKTTRQMKVTKARLATMDTKSPEYRRLREGMVDGLAKVNETSDALEEMLGRKPINGDPYYSRANEAGSLDRRIADGDLPAAIQSQRKSMGNKPLEFKPAKPHYGKSQSTHENLPKVYDLDAQLPNRPVTQDDIRSALADVEALYADKGSSKKKTAIDTDGDFKPTAKNKTLADYEADFARQGNPGLMAKSAAAFQKLGEIKGVADQLAGVGNFCKMTEDYNAGRIQTVPYARYCVEQIPYVGDALGLGFAIGEKTSDYISAKRYVDQANESNMTAYLNEWTVVLKKAGYSTEDARRLVSNAVMKNDLRELDSIGNDLVWSGHTFKRPKLTVNYVEADDTFAERSLAVLVGTVKGTYDGLEYIVTAPYRTVMAWGEGQNAESDLESHSKEILQASREDVYRRLRAYGYSAGRILSALEKRDKGDFSALRKMRNEVVAEREERQRRAENFNQFRRFVAAGIDPERVEKAMREANSTKSASPWTAMAEEAEKIEIEREKQYREHVALMRAAYEKEQKRLDAQYALIREIYAHMAYLANAPLTLVPSPRSVLLDVTKTQSLVNLELLLEGRGNLEATLNQLTSLLNEEPGPRSSADISVSFSIPGRRGERLGTFCTAVPQEKGTHRAEATLKVRITGPWADYFPAIERTVAVDIPVRGDVARENELVWWLLDRAVTVEIPGYGTATIRRSQSGTSRFEAIGTDGEVFDFQFSGDGLHITTIDAGNFVLRAPLTEFNARNHGKTRALFIFSPDENSLMYIGAENSWVCADKEKYCPRHPEFIFHLKPWTVEDDLARPKVFTIDKERHLEDRLAYVDEKAEEMEALAADIQAKRAAIPADIKKKLEKLEADIARMAKDPRNESEETATPEFKKTLKDYNALCAKAGLDLDAIFDEAFSAIDDLRSVEDDLRDAHRETVKILDPKMAAEVRRLEDEMVDYVRRHPGAENSPKMQELEEALVEARQIGYEEDEDESLERFDSAVDQARSNLRNADCVEDQIRQHKALVKAQNARDDARYQTDKKRLEAEMADLRKRTARYEEALSKEENEQLSAEYESTIESLQATLERNEFSYSELNREHDRTMVLRNRTGDLSLELAGVNYRLSALHKRMADASPDESRRLQTQIDQLSAKADSLATRIKATERDINAQD